MVARRLAVRYSRHIVEVLRTEEFETWLRKLKDLRGRTRIVQRIDRLADGNPGDVKSVGQGVTELRLHFGPGYRVYCVQDGETLVLLLCGGDKSTQNEDIEKAHEIADRWRLDKQRDAKR